jgi:hypothetical protein
MTARSSVALILIAGVLGVLVGRTLPRDRISVQKAPSPTSASSIATPAAHSCQAERSTLALTKTQLTICMAFDAWAPEAEPSNVPQVSGPNPSAREPRGPPQIPRDEEIRRNRKLLKSYSEALIVQHDDGRTEVYKPDEWHNDGDGVIVARKFPSGDIGWYSGPDAGPRSDPSAFHTFADSSDFVEPIIETAPDGTILVNGEPADPAVQRMFGGSAKPARGDAP